MITQIKSKNNPTDNVLIIKLAAIGDVLMATPAFEAIRKKHADSKIHLLIGKWAKPVIENNPNIDEIIEIDENIFWKKKIFELVSLLFKLRKIKFSTVYVMHWTNYFNLFAYLIGAKYRIGFDRHHNSKFLTKKLPFSEAYKGLHVTEYYLTLADVNLDKADKSMKYFIKGEEAKIARNEVNRLCIADNELIIGLAPGGGVTPKSNVQNRRWPMEHFISLFQLICGNIKCRVFIFGGASDSGSGKAISAVNSDLINDYTGKLSLRQTAALMQHCKVVIANDTGLLHLAGALGVATISIFGPTVPWDKVPLCGNNHYFYTSEKCSPCFDWRKDNNCHQRQCLTKIQSTEVFTKLKVILNELKINI